MKTRLPILFLSLSMWPAQTTGVAPPRPVQPTPTAAQLSWQRLEYYAFVHFGMNTFTDQEWGEGRAHPDVFNPSSLDCRQWARVVRDAGMKGIIITAKHHDGFCLWPSGTTTYSVKYSSWRGGNGDVLKDLSEACREYGLKFGVYISVGSKSSPLWHAQVQPRLQGSVARSSNRLWRGFRSMAGRSQRPA